MPEFTLQQINDAAEEQFGPFVIPDVPGGPVTLLNPTRMSKDKRRKLVQLQSTINNPDAAEEDQIDAALEGMRDMVTLVAKTKAEGDRLLKAIGDDQGKLMIVLQEYGKASRTGEASPSPS